MDASGSIGSINFQSVKQYVSNIILGFDDKVRVGVVTFSNSAYTSLDLTPAASKTCIASIITGILYYGDGTNTYEGINTAASLLGHQKDIGVSRVLIVLTDGRSNSRTSTLQAAQAAKDQGIQIYAVGIGSGVDVNELQDMASSPSSDYLLPIGNFSTAAFNEMIEPLRKSACLSELTDCNATVVLRQVTNIYLPQNLRLVLVYVQRWKS